MFGMEDGSELVQCPYDSTHRVMRKRLQMHLLRCKKNNPNVELQKCPFNISHLIPEADFVNHINSCPDRKIVTHYKYQLKDDSKRKELPKRNGFKSDENWDA